MKSKTSFTYGTVHRTYLSGNFFKKITNYLFVIVGSLIVLLLLQVYPNLTSR